MSDVGIRGFLRELGFSGREANVLGLLLEKGALTVSEISDSLGIARPHIYTVLKSLMRRGLVARIVGRPARYTAEPAVYTLRRLFREKTKMWESILEELELRIKSYRGVLLVEDSSSFLDILYLRAKEAGFRVWLVIPGVLEHTVKELLRNVSRRAELRVVIGSLPLLRGLDLPPTVGRYVEPASPFLLAVVDNTVFFAPVVGEKIIWGVVIEGAREYVDYFEHIWSEDYVTTLYKFRMKSPKQY